MATRLLIAALLLCPPVLSADTSPDSAAPSLELLEYIADFGDLDEATLQLLEYHARQDLLQASSSQPPLQPSEEKRHEPTESR